MNNTTQQVVDKVNHTLDTVALKIGEGTDYFWPILVKQQFILGACAVVACTITLGIMLFLIFVQSKKASDDLKLRLSFPLQSKKASDDLKFGLIVPASVVSFFMMFILALEPIPRLLNPEYYALKDILSQLGL